MAIENDQIIAEFRANEGVVGGHFEGKHLVVLHTVGRRSGAPRLNPLVYAEDGDSLLLCGSMGGAPKDPEWVANVAAVSEVTVEVGTRTLKAAARVVTGDSPEWERVYGVWSAYWPESKEYEKNTNRKFPIVVLDPIAG
jgi:deazaflavin-dependent oxidoreductase (nitroreductase family)